MDKMTEQMAIEDLKSYADSSWGDLNESFALAIQSLEEIQQYREIGTVEELQALKEKSVAKKPKKPIYREGVVIEGSCPVCEKAISRHTSYMGCVWCLQRLDWE